MGGVAKPLISIILTTYNSEFTIRPVLESIINQDFPLDRTEFIIVDDGSRDSTTKIVREFLEMYKSSFARVEFVAHDKNYGVSKARNDGIKLSRGEYVLILDHDVILARETLKTLYSYLENSPRKVLCAVPLHLNVAGGKLQKIYEEIHRGKVVKRLSNITSCALCRRVDLIEHVGLYDEALGPPYTIYEDVELGERALAKGYEIHLIGWHAVTHDTREPPQKPHIVSSIAKRGRLIAVLKSLLDPKYRYALRKMLRSAPLSDKIRWRLYQLFLILFTASIPGVVVLPQLPLATLVLFTILWLDAVRQYWNPRKTRLALIYATSALGWRIARSVMLFLPPPTLKKSLASAG
ncbi:glycosyltransferase [Pyrobaculum sp.]|uniref:glycosyltransferase n=1 Tax=Pyrobaculum sp. TaxID=2004705 RepID=UPI003D1342F2